MTQPTTQRDEIRQLLAGSSDPLTRPEIFERCKLVGDERTLSTILSQLVTSGEIRRVGARARDKGVALALYAAGSAKPARAAKPKRATKAERKAAGGGARLTRKKRPRPVARRAPAGRKRVPKVQPNTADPVTPEGFRCGIFNDGSLAIRAAEGEFTLTEPETRAMFKYLDRVLGSEAA